MRKIGTILLMAILCFNLVACGSKGSAVTTETKEDVVEPKDEIEKATAQESEEEPEIETYAPRFDHKEFIKDGVFHIDALLAEYEATVTDFIHDPETSWSMMFIQTKEGCSLNLIGGATNQYSLDLEMYYAPDDADPEAVYTINLISRDGVQLIDTTTEGLRMDTYAIELLNIALDQASNLKSGECPFDVIDAAHVVIGSGEPEYHE